ncbi:MAG: DsbA family oxidoreductase [Chromatiales bacterium]|nr:MAG: DsbA family oxidoreductase [Chromatiales bacterium]
MTALQIEIVSDPVCPWCYIGKRRLEAALARHPDVAAEIRWSPFQLSPDMPREGRDRAEHYAAIFGDERAATIRDSMAETARQEGLEFQWLDGARSPNTLGAHVLMDLATDTPGGDTSALAEALFHAHHVDCADLGDPNLLIRLGADAGIDAETVGAALADAERGNRVRAQIQQAAARGVSGVPFFVFNDRYAVSGAQPADALADLISRLTA